MHRFLYLVALVALFGAATAADAQTIPSPYRYIESTMSLEVFGGYLQTDPGDLEIGPQSAPQFGVRFLGRISGPVAGEAHLSVIPSNRKVMGAIDETNPEQGLVERGEENALLLSLHGGLRFNITGARTWNNLAPYLAASGGILLNVTGRGGLDDAIPASQRFESGPAFAMSIGAGTDWFITERYSLRLDVRDNIWRLRNPTGLRVLTNGETEWVHNLGLAAGVAYHF